MGRRYLEIVQVRRVAYLRLISRERFNTLHRDCIREIKTALEQLEREDQIACIVITGDPGESFAVGANIVEMKDFTSRQAWDFACLGQALFSYMEGLSKPIIGALNGITMGGGCDLALACDIRLASDRLKLAHPGAKLGIITGFGGTQKLPRLVGRNKAKEIFMTSQVYSAEECLECGLVEQVFPATQFMDEVAVYAERIASQPPMALDLVKKLLNAAEDVAIEQGQIMEIGAFSSLFPRQGRMEKMEDFFSEHGSD